MAARCHMHRTQTTRMWPCPRPTFRYALPARGDTSQKFTRLALQESARSIKLGLGDFVFYSVLVSRAALFGFATFAACFVAVIMVCPLCVGGMEKLRLHGGDGGSLCRVSLAPYCCWASSRRRFQPSRSRLLWASPSISPPALSCFQWLYHWPLLGRAFEGPVRPRVFPH